MNLDAIANVLQVMMRVLSKHVLCFIALIMTFSLFCWSMYMSSWMATTTAGIFGGVIFLPVLWRTMEKGDTDGNST